MLVEYHSNPRLNHAISGVMETSSWLRTSTLTVWWVLAPSLPCLLVRFRHRTWLNKCLSMPRNTRNWSCTFAEYLGVYYDTVVTIARGLCSVMLQTGQGPWLILRHARLCNATQCSLYIQGQQWNHITVRQNCGFLGFKMDVTPCSGLRFNILQRTASVQSLIWVRSSASLQ